MWIEDATAPVVRSRGYEQLGMEERIANFVSPVTELSKVVQMVRAGEPLAGRPRRAAREWTRGSELSSPRLRGRELA